MPLDLEDKTMTDLPALGKREAGCVVVLGAVLSAEDAMRRKAAFNIAKEQQVGSDACRTDLLYEMYPQCALWNVRVIVT